MIKKARERWDCVRICTEFAIRAAYQNPQRNVLPRTRRPALLRRRRARSGVAAATRDWEGVSERGGAEGWWQRGAPRIFSLLSGSPLSCLSLSSLHTFTRFSALSPLFYISNFIFPGLDLILRVKLFILFRTAVWTQYFRFLLIVHSRFCSFYVPIIVCILVLSLAYCCWETWFQDS